MLKKMLFAVMMMAASVRPRSHAERYRLSSISCHAL